ncbi:MAG: hypothetical protein WBC78_07285 [Candidatus Sulfotelmatobacter sp.]
MPHNSNEPNHLLTQLEAAKSRFNPGHAAIVARLLGGISRLRLIDPHQLVRFHECLLFLRAFPHAVSQIARVENLLNTFHQRIDKLRAANGDMFVFDDFDTSGITGTTMQDTLSFDVAQWLVSRIPKDVDIAWDDYWQDYQVERARGNTWPRFIPLLEEDADVEANIPWPAWLEAARGRQQPLIWLLNRFAQLPLPARQRAELYDSLRLPLRWRLGNLKLSRSRKWKRPLRFYFHSAGLIQRSEVSLARELARPAPKLEKLSLAAGEAVMHDIREIMVVRYRELYGTTLGDPSSVVRADLGRGVVMHFWGLPADRRLPLRAYLAGYTLKNGVPINYIEAMGLCEWIEVGFNTFYTYRQGETAWIYAQALRCLRALTAATCISIYPYQIGQNNEEAIDSGAFWFYRKLGFRPGRPDLQALCEREEMRIAANAQYRTPPRTLRRLAEAHMFYDLSDAEVGVDGVLKEQVLKGWVLKGRGFSRALKAAKSSAASVEEGRCGPWDTFSTRNLGLRINRSMGREFSGDSRRVRQSSTAAVARALNINPGRWTLPQRQTFENWSLVLALMPDLARWSPQEKSQLIKIIRAKSAPSEMRYLRQTQHHPRLRAELLRLGSKS